MASELMPNPALPMRFFWKISYNHPKTQVWTENPR